MGKKTIDPQVDKFIAPVHVVPDSGDGGPASYQLSSDGGTLAYFRVKPERGVFPYFSGYFRSVEIIQPDGSILQLAAQDGWWELGPELLPGHFGILAFDSDFAADILDLSYTDTDGKLTLNKLEDLSFTINVAAVTRDKPVRISQDWQYLAYMSAPTPPKYVTNLTIFSRAADEVVWELPVMKSVVPRVFWNTTSETIAWVNFWGTDGDALLFGIGKNGEITTTYDVAKILGEKVQISGGTEQVSAEGNLGLWLLDDLNNGLIDKGLYLFNVDSGTIIDLCITDKTAHSVYFWAENGKYLLVPRFDGFNAAPLEMMIIDVATGNYSLQYLANDGQALYLVAWSKPQEQAQQK